MSYLIYLYLSDSIKLVIEEDVVGFYLIVWKNPHSEKSDADYLFDTLDDAFEEAEGIGVRPDILTFFCC